jgi:hypothetical protein
MQENAAQWDEDWDKFEDEGMFLGMQYYGKLALKELIQEHKYMSRLSLIFWPPLRVHICSRIYGGRNCWK